VGLFFTIPVALTAITFAYEEAKHEEEKAAVPAT